jgi:two-component system C4-dicarboxylate transport sensor histidine kinase DctB
MSDKERLRETGRLAEVGLQAATLVHELRQPIFAIKAMAQLMLEEGASDSGDRLRDLLAQVEVLESLIERYGNASRRPTGAVVPVDLRDAVEAGIQVVGGQRPGIQTQWCPPAKPVWAATDPIAVQQITSNLVRNAVDAARSQVLVELTESSLRVQDDGAGIRPDIESRLGEAFVTSKPPGEGTGLGLTVTQSLVEVIGGRFSWTTGPNGTCFEVEWHNGQAQD